MHLGIIESDCLCISRFHCVGSGTGVLKAALDFKALVGIRINAHAKPHPVRRGIPFSGQTFGQFFEDIFIIAPARAIDKEGIRTSAAGNAAQIAGDLSDAFSYASKHAVPVLLSVALIDHMEMIDIHDHSIHRHIRIMLIVQPDVAQEVIQVEQICQTVALCRMYDIPLFRKLDAAVDSGVHDFP